MNPYENSAFSQNRLYQNIDGHYSTGCVPSPDADWALMQTFSPGVCISGDRAVVTHTQGEEIREICCERGFTWQVISCVKSFSGEEMAVTVWEDGEEKGTETVDSGVFVGRMYAVFWREGDEREETGSLTSTVSKGAVSIPPTTSEISTVVTTTEQADEEEEEVEETSSDTPTRSTKITVTVPFDESGPIYSPPPTITSTITTTFRTYRQATLTLDGHPTTSTETPTPSSSSTADSTLKGASLIGIAVGIGLFVGFLLILVGWCCYRRRKRLGTGEAVPVPEENIGKPELDGNDSAVSPAEPQVPYSGPIESPQGHVYHTQDYSEMPGVNGYHGEAPTNAVLELPADCGMYTPPVGCNIIRSPRFVEVGVPDTPEWQPRQHNIPAVTPYVEMDGQPVIGEMRSCCQTVIVETTSTRNSSQSESRNIYSEMQENRHAVLPAGRPVVVAESPVVWHSAASDWSEVDGAEWYMRSSERRRAS